MDSPSIVDAFDMISDFNSKEQIQKAVQCMSSVEEKKIMIDRILNRREEIKSSLENYKILKYAHIFKRFLHKFKSQKLIRERLKSPTQQKTTGPNTNQNSILTADPTIQDQSIISDENVIQQRAKNALENALMSFQHRKSLPTVEDNNQMLIVDKQDLNIERKLQKIQETQNQLMGKTQQFSPRKKKIKELIKEAKPKIDTGLKHMKLRSSHVLPNIINQQTFIQQRRQGRYIEVQVTAPAEQRRSSVAEGTVNADESPKLQQAGTKLPQLGKYFTIIDPLQVREQVESEIYEFLQSQRHMNIFQKELFLRGDNKTQTKTIRQMDSKIKFKLNLEEINKREAFIKNQYAGGVKLYDLHKKTKSSSQIKISLSPQGGQGSQTSRALQKTMRQQALVAKEQMDESYASYTEIKLNQLYQNSKELQNTVQKMEIANFNNNEDLKSFRKYTDIKNQFDFKIQNISKEIIELSQKKVHSNRAAII